MKDEVHKAIDALVGVKQHVETLINIQEKIESGRKELLAVNGQLEKLRQTVKEERDARAREAHEEKKRHDEAVIARQNEAEFVQADVEKAKDELKAIQNDTAKWQKRFDELSGKTNKLEKALA